MATIVRLSKIAAVYDGRIESVVHSADMPNGSLINLGGFVTGETELRQVAVPATATLGSEEVLLVASPEVMYDAGKGIADFVNPANKPARAFHLTVGDIFEITTDGVDGTPAVGKYIIPQNNSMKPVVANDLSAGTRFAGKIIDTTKLGYNKANAIVVQVVKA